MVQPRGMIAESAMLPGADATDLPLGVSGHSTGMGEQADQAAGSNMRGADVQKTGGFDLALTVAARRRFLPLKARV